jgi:hypothetical protein
MISTVMGSSEEWKPQWIHQWICIKAWFKFFVSEKQVATPINNIPKIDFLKPSNLANPPK